MGGAQAIQNVQYVTYVGINELWEWSVLVFHATFPSLLPQQSDFNLGESSGASEVLDYMFSAPSQHYSGCCLFE